MTTTVTMITTVETTPTTTGTTLTRDAVWENINSCIAHTVRHVIHTWWPRSCAGRNTR